MEIYLMIVVAGFGLQWLSIYDEVQLLEQLLSGAHPVSSDCDFNKDGGPGHM